MKVLLILSILLNIAITSIKAQNKGFVSVNMMEVILSDDTVSIWDNAGVFVKISKKLMLKNEEYDIKEHNTKELKSKLGAFVFEPDYDLLIFECTDILPDRYIVKVNNESKEIPIGQKHITYETVQQHILNNYIVLSKKSPLRNQPSDDSHVIENYRQNSYLPIKIEGDWLKVKCNMDCEGCFDGKLIEGWVKWRDCSGKLLIRIYYRC
jgi:hypothetical protein